jgi:plastocyanin
MRIFAKYALVAVALAAAALAPPPALAQTAGGASPSHHVVEIRKLKFVPAALTIRRGDTVEWINRDIVPHTATESEAEWDTDKLTKGQSGRVTFLQPGLAAYFCVFHPSMKGEITVTEN